LWWGSRSVRAALANQWPLRGGGVGLVVGQQERAHNACKTVAHKGWGCWAGGGAAGARGCRCGVEWVWSCVAASQSAAQSHPIVRGSFAVTLAYTIGAQSLATSCPAWPESLFHQFHFGGSSDWSLGRASLYDGGLCGGGLCEGSCWLVSGRGPGEQERGGCEGWAGGWVQVLARWVLSWAATGCGSIFRAGRTGRIEGRANTRRSALQIKSDPTQQERPTHSLEAPMAQKPHSQT
jgi:hypothetical protein